MSITAASITTASSTAVLRRRSLAAAVAVLLGSLVLASCGAGGAAAVSQSLESDPRPTPELAPEPQPGGPGPEDLPGLDDLPEDLEDLVPDLSVPELDTGAVGECLDLTSAMTEVMVLPFTGDPEGRLPGLLDELEAGLPADLQDELDVVRSTVEDVSGDSLLEVSGAMLSQDFVDASGAILEWTTSRCEAAQPGQLD